MKRLLMAVSGWLDWLSDRIRPKPGDPPSVRLTEGIILCPRCDWQETGPTHYLEWAWVRHMAARHP